MTTPRTSKWIRPASTFIDDFANLMVKHQVRWCSDFYIEFRGDIGTPWEVYVDKKRAHIRPVSWDGPEYGAKEG